MQNRTSKGDRLVSGVGRVARDSSRWLVLSAVLAAGVALGSGCVGDIGDRAGGASGQDCANCGPNAEVASLDTSRFPRLTHTQWELTVRDLLHLGDVPGLSSSFTGDPLGGVFDNNETSLLVTPGLWADYQLAAEDLAAVVTGDPAKLAAILPANLPSDAAAKNKAFVEGFGKRAFRRPLTEAEVSAFVALFEKAKTCIDGPDDFTKGVNLVMQAMLQSPHFVYRVESSSEVVDGLIPLNGWEIATKLSYLMWNTMPDDKLLEAAGAGKLGTPEGIMAEAQRLLEDDQARGVVSWFHEQLYQYDHYYDLTKDPDLFPDFTPDLANDMKKEAQLFVENVVFADDGGVGELLTSPYTFVNAKTAQYYGLDPADYGTDFEKVDLDPKERSGFLTHLGFLASNATKREQHSIHRGVFINRRIICADLPNPPDKIPPLPPIEGTQTNRDRVDAATGKGTCGEARHGRLINPAGFAFEHYDAMGQFHTEENGSPVDSSATYPFNDGEQTYQDAIGFDQILADQDMVHACYAKYWLEYGYGRRVQNGDTSALQELATKSRESVQTLVLALTQTKAFRTRAPAKEAP